MINRRIATSGISILAAAAMMAAGTFAFFSDEATSTENTFGAGTMVLELDDSNEPFEAGPPNDVTATFDLDDMAPGDMDAQEISFHNEGSIDIAEIAMGLTSSFIDPGDDGSDLRDVLNMEIVEGGTASEGSCTGGTPVTGAIDAIVGNGGSPLTMKEFTGDTYDSLAIALSPSSTGKVCIKITMDEEAGDIYQGDSADATFTFTAHQDVSQ